MSNRPTILLVDNSISYTGALKCALQQASILSNEYRYVFVMPEGSSALSTVNKSGFKVYTLPMLEIRKHAGALLRYFPRLHRNVRKLKKIVKAEGVQIVVMNDFYNLLGVGLRKQGVPVKLITFVRFLPEVMPRPLRSLWVGAALQYADAVVAVSDVVNNQLPSCPKVHRIYDALYFLEQLQTKEPPSKEVTKLLYLSNFIPGKGQDHALSAFCHAYKKNSSLRLLFVGGDMGLKKNRAFKALLEQRVKTLELEDIVRFQAFQEDVESLYKQADIVLNFSEAESFSMTCAEAAFYGMPTIATRCGGPEEIIVDGKTGLLVENRNVAQMTEAILRLAANPDLQVQFSKASRHYVRQKFSAEQFVSSFKLLLDTPVSL